MTVVPAPLPPALTLRRMRATAAAAVTATLLGGSLVLSDPALAQQREAPADFTNLVEEKMPGVVGILSTSVQTPPPQTSRPQLPPGLEEFFGMPRQFGPGQDPGAAPRRMQSQGSGFIISADGHVVTNNHVIAGAQEIEVRLEDGRQVTAELVGTDPATDIALLRIDGIDDLPHVEWGDSEDLQIGEWLVAIGNPFGLGGTVTAGILSARSRNINAGPYDDFLQTDAAINRGNSGGPLFNADGEVIGVNTAIFSPTGGSVGIGFAVPSLVAQNIVEQLRETGVVERGWLGVQIQAVNEELAEALELAEPAGALIADVARGGPADEAGLRAGDVVIDFAGEDIETPRDLTFAVAEFEQGSDAAVRIVRDGEEQLISVEIGALPQPDMPEPSASPAEDGPELGVSLAPMTPELRERFGVTEGVEGAIISGVRNGSPAAEAGLRSGDVVVEANGTPIEAPQDLVEVVEQVAEENGTILMRLFRQGAYDFRVVSLEET